MANLYSRNLALDICPLCSAKAEIVFMRVDCSNKNCRHFSKALVGSIKVGDRVLFICRTIQADWSDWNAFEISRKDRPWQLNFFPEYCKDNPPIVEIIEGKWAMFNNWHNGFAPITALKRV